ncbi:glycosyltransferase family 4 protein [uncultured Polaribacter sp.]|uniref:glycosyltransferase family 4 protein n=1 Tax=uncultured Polaribacter sp. TaxID=174711 RepID=UPI002615FC0E|nr:glycosyltransferase family 4 protein [uncultured Polaribacter sp.]
MKVLIITYYWPPAGGSGVQRWLKFVKYLQDFGIEPIIYTVANANYPKEDVSLIKEIPKNVTILKQPIWEPTDLFFWKKKSANKKGIANVSKGGFLSFIRGNFFVPDPKVFWVNKSVNYLENYISKNTIDLIISTGPPHSMHLIAQKLKNKTGLKWMVDFRDPWSNLYYNNDFKQLSFAKKKNFKFEKSVLQEADCVLTVSNHLKQGFVKFAKNVKVVTNGFDDENSDNLKTALDIKFSISYIGLLPKQSNPKLLFKVLREMSKENLDFKKDLALNFIGDISEEIKTEINLNNLEEQSSFKGYVSHKKAIAFQNKSQVLLLLIPNVPNNKGILTGKLFEYLKAKRPILAIGPENGDLAAVLKDTNAGTVIDFKDHQKMKEEILRLYTLFKANKLKLDSKNIQRYHRKALTEQLAFIIKNV